MNNSNTQWRKKEELTTDQHQLYNEIGEKVVWTKSKQESARESTYLRQVNLYRRLFIEKFLRCHIQTVPGNMHVKFEVRSFNRFGAISI